MPVAVFGTADGQRIASAVQWVEGRQRSATGRPRWTPRPTDNFIEIVRFGIVVGFADEADRFVQVVEPKRNDSDPWDGGFVIPDDAEASRVRCWPPLRARDFTDFVWQGSSGKPPFVLTDDANWMPVIQIKGVWFVMVLPLFGFAPFPVGAPFSDCRNP